MIKRVMVTGIEGYIGSVLAPLLEQAGYEVIGLDIGYFTEGRFGNLVGPQVIERQDVRDTRTLDLSGIDAIVHLAALSNDPMGDLDPALTMEINHASTVRLAKAAREAGVMRFVFSSSCSIYGQTGSEALTENDSFAPQTAYARSKVLTEKDLAELADESFCPVFLRNGTAYGVSPRMRFDLVINNLCGWAHTTGEMILLSDGSPWRPMVHIRDISEAFRAALSCPREQVFNQAFNVGHHGENHQVSAMAEAVQQAFPGSRIKLSEKASPDNRTYKVSFEKIHSQLEGFRSVWTIEDGIAECATKLKEFDIDRADFESRRYVRLKQLKHLIAANEISASLRWISPG